MSGHRTHPVIKPGSTNHRHPARPEGRPGDAQTRRWLRLDIQYDGTDFLGWQRQAEGRTVQAVLEEALERILRQEHRVVGAGRTDSGTHARHMVVSFETQHGMPAGDLARALDAVLPADVGVLSAREARPGFHARRDASWKWYRYTLLRCRGRRPLHRRRAWHVRGALDHSALEAGAAALEGRHDFRAFASTGSPRRTTVRTLHAVRWSQDDADDDLLHLEVVGDGFLYRMVRSIAGTLVHLARSRALPDREALSRPPGREADLGPMDREAGSLPMGREAGPLPMGREAVQPPVGREAGMAIENLLATGNRARTGPVAPARGLCLMAVGVGEDASDGRLPPFLLRAVESGRRVSPGGLP